MVYVNKITPEPLDMSKYGHILEEYDYKLEKGKVKDITFSKYDKNGEVEKLVEVSDDNGHYHRVIMKWPDMDMSGGSVLEMKLDLETIDPGFTLDSVELFTYDNSEEKYTDTFRIPIKRVGKLDFKLEIDMDHRVAHYKNLNLYKSYPKDSEFADEEFRVFDNCFVWKNIKHGTILLQYFDDEGNVSSYKQLDKKRYPHTGIDIIDQLSYGSLEINRNLIYYSYDDNELIDNVVYYQGPEVNTNLRRVETYTSYSDLTETKYAAVYPTLLTLDDQDLADYNKYGELWNFDEAVLDESDHITQFVRRVYVINDNDLLNSMFSYIYGFMEDTILL